MKMHTLAIGVAVLALSAAPALAQGKGGGNGHDGGSPQGQSGGSGKGNGGDKGGAKANGGGKSASGGQANGGGKSAGGGKAEARGPETRPARADGADRGRNPGSAAERGKPNGASTAIRGGNAQSDRNPGSDRSTPYRWSSAPLHGLVDGCPPGLAKKNNGCTPPGLAKSNPWQGYYDRPDWWGYRGLSGGRYDYYDGYLVRYDGSRIASYIPLLGGALGVGGLWPGDYQSVELPSYYEDYYGLGPSYRYADDVLYRVDPQTSTIESIAALLTGNEFAVGQRLPDDYDVYNVPYGYRDRYADGPDADYRYSDGYVYQVDPTTQLIQAAIELLL